MSDSGYKRIVIEQQESAKKRQDWTPDVGNEITINLPDEVTRGTVERIISHSRLIAKIAHFTTNNKSHPYKKGDFVAAEYRRGSMGLPGWYEISQEDLDQAAAPEPPREMQSGDL